MARSKRTAGRGGYKAGSYKFRSQGTKNTSEAADVADNGIYSKIDANPQFDTASTHSMTMLATARHTERQQGSSRRAGRPKLGMNFCYGGVLGKADERQNELDYQVLDAIEFQQRKESDHDKATAVVDRDSDSPEVEQATSDYAEPRTPRTAAAQNDDRSDSSLDIVLFRGRMRWPVHGKTDNGDKVRTGISTMRAKKESTATSPTSITGQDAFIHKAPNPTDNTAYHKQLANFPNKTSLTNGNNQRSERRAMEFLVSGTGMDSRNEITQQFDAKTVDENKCEFRQHEKYKSLYQDHLAQSTNEELAKRTLTSVEEPVASCRDEESISTFHDRLLPACKDTMGGVSQDLQDVPDNTETSSIEFKDGVNEVETESGDITKSLDSSAGRSRPRKETSKILKSEKQAEGNRIGGKNKYDVLESTDLSILTPPMPSAPERTISALSYENFDLFDLVDRSRSSICDSRHEKSRNSYLQHSDSELERSLIRSWNADRARKASKRKQRQAARAEDALRRHAQEFLANTKSFEWEDVKETFCNFLNSSAESLRFPPMDKQDRKVVHEFANSFNLKSKSSGSGERRFTSVYKTSRTLEFSDTMFENIMTTIEGRFIRGFRRHRSDKQPKAKSLTTKSNLPYTKASYRDGEVVGAEAPEIGVENRGRAMLEKMGWKSGTALGAESNKGILQPLPQTVKNSKSGLG